MAYFSIRLMALADIFGYSSPCSDPYPAEIDLLFIKYFFLKLQTVDIFLPY
jgi:hypothetical protein